MDQSKPALINSLEILEDMYQQNRWPSVIVLEGTKEIRQAILEAFIQLVFCQKTIRCGQCESCLLMKANSHPDIYMVQPEQVGHAIKIEQIREILDICLQTPLLAKHQLVIIEQADALNVNAANALLKVLEEPSLSTHFFLLVDNHQLLIPTIRSRAWILNARSVPLKPNYDNELRELMPLLHAFLQNNVSIAVLLAYFEGRSLDDTLLLLQCLSYHILANRTLATKPQNLTDLALMTAIPMDLWWQFYDLCMTYRRQNMLQASMQANLALSRLFFILKGFY
jgi:DNA polymerase III, delta subunit